MSKHSAVELWQQCVQNHGIRPEDIQNAGKDRLLALQKQLGLGENWGLIQVPEEWLPPGCTVISHGTIRLAKLTLKNARNDQEIELANVVLTRLVLLLLIVSPFQTRSRPLKIRTIVETGGIIQKTLIRPALLLPMTSSNKLLSRLNASVNDQSILGTSARHVKERAKEVLRLGALSARGLWSDFPTIAQKAGFEKPRKFQPLGETVEDESGTHLPFSDEFVAEAGWRAAWLTEHLAMALIEAAERLQVLKLTLHPDISNGELLNAEEQMLDGHSFLDRDGRAIKQLPFRVARGRKVWPPKNSAQIYQLLETVQAAHLFVVSLSTGGRISEVLSLLTDCLVDSEPGDRPTTATGRTYKLVFAPGGKLRDWPLPALAIQAVKNQSRMVRLSNSSKKARSLWCAFIGSRRGQALLNHQTHLRNFVSWLGLDHLLGDQKMRAHRFRKTIARLVALALVEAPKVLMDIFGHNSISMTMRYILADPMIRVEMDTVRRELVVMFAAKAIENADSNGGPAAAPLKRAISDARIRTGLTWGQDDIRALAFTLTANGDHWTLVRPGVLCTKQPSQSGPCNANQSAPDPSRCRTHCAHRLEDASARDDANRSIQQAVDFVQIAIEAENEIEKELWMGQILAHVRRFDDLQNIWLSNPIVALLLESEKLAA